VPAGSVSHCCTAFDMQYVEKTTRSLATFWRNSRSSASPLLPPPASRSLREIPRMIGQHVAFLTRSGPYHPSFAASHSCRRGRALPSALRIGGLIN
jgi:hypothetical protein